MDPGQTFIIVLVGFFMIFVVVEIYQYCIKKSDPVLDGYVNYVGYA
jgi:hypothetical protein